MKETTKEKVYCRKCKYKIRGWHFDNGEICCRKTESLKNEFSDKEQYYNRCSTVNKNGECENYKKKWYKL